MLQSRRAISNGVAAAAVTVLVIMAGVSATLYATKNPQTVTSTAVSTRAVTSTVVSSVTSTVVSTSTLPAPPTAARVQMLTRVNVPLAIPLGHGFARDGDVFFITTEASDQALANSLTDKTGFKVTFAPNIAKAPASAVAKIYVFTSGIKGTGYLGFQPEVFDSVPGDSGYSPAWKVEQVTWNAGATPQVLKSDNEIEAAQSAGQLTVAEPGIVVNCPIIKWPGGSLPLLTQPMTDQTAYGSAQVVSIDTNAMKVTFRAHRGWGPDGQTIYYIATEASDKDAAKGLGITYAPKLKNMSGSPAQSPLYQFSNGITGSGPLGFQAGIGATVPGQQAYSPFWTIQAITWNTPADAVILESTIDISAVRNSIGIQSGPIVNCAFLSLS